MSFYERHVCTLGRLKQTRPETNLEPDWIVLVLARLYPHEQAWLLSVESKPTSYKGLQKPTVNCCG